MSLPKNLFKPESSYLFFFNLVLLCEFLEAWMQAKIDYHWELIFHYFSLASLYKYHYIVFIYLFMWDLLVMTIWISKHLFTFFKLFKIWTSITISLKAIVRALFVPTTPTPHCSISSQSKPSNEQQTLFLFLNLLKESLQSYINYSFLLLKSNAVRFKYCSPSWKSTLTLQWVNMCLQLNTETFISMFWLADNSA